MRPTVFRPTPSLSGPCVVMGSPEMVYWRSAVHHYNEGALAAEEVDEQLEEGVEGEGFVDVAEGADPEGYAEGDEGGPGGGGEDGDEDEDADYVALEEGFAVVFCLEED